MAMSLTANDASSGFQKMGGKPLRAQMCKRESGNQERSPHVRIERSLEVPAPPLVEAPTAEKEAVHKECLPSLARFFVLESPVQRGSYSGRRKLTRSARCSDLLRVCLRLRGLARGLMQHYKLLLNPVFRVFF